MMRTLSILLSCLAISFASYSWGPTGHRAVGQVASTLVSKKAAKKINGVLNGQSIALAGTWMDEIRSDSTYDHMVDWHWVTIPEGKTYDQSEKNPKGDLVETLERVIKALKSKTLTPKQETEHLKMLIHLIGDLHMPLHVGTRNDRGGNDVKVTWFGANSNLHRVWDSDMIDDTRLSYTELAASLGTPSKSDLSLWQHTTIREWADESRGYQKTLYNQNGKLGYEYAYKNFPIVRLRLLQAGVRLAGILNEIYG